MSGVERYASTRRETRKQRRQAEQARIAYDPKVYDILNNRRTVPAGSVRSETMVPKLCWVTYDDEADAYTVYRKGEKEILENAGINLRFEERLVYFYGEDDMDVQSLAKTARYKLTIDCKLTKTEQAALDAEEKVEGIEEQRKELLKICEDRGLLPEKVGKDELERQQMAADFAEALGVSIPIFDNQLPSNEVLVERLATGRVETNTTTGQASQPAALPDKTVEMPEPLKMLVKDVVKEALSQYQPRGNADPNNQKKTGKPKKASGQNGKQGQKSQRPSPDDFGDDDQDQNQDQQPANDGFPFTLDENGNIPGLDEQATAAIIQRYESEKKKAANNKGGNA